MRAAVDSRDGYEVLVADDARAIESGKAARGS
jgi:hypothetical protein